MPLIYQQCQILNFLKITQVSLEAVRTRMETTQQ